MHLVPPYDGDENIGSVPLTTSLDTWDGIKWRFQQTGCHLGVGRLSGGKIGSAATKETWHRILSGDRKEGRS